MTSHRIQLGDTQLTRLVVAAENADDLTLRHHMVTAVDKLEGVVLHLHPQQTPVVTKTQGTNIHVRWLVADT
jgi:hypothetical protein